MRRLQLSTLCPCPPTRPPTLSPSSISATVASEETALEASTLSTVSPLLSLRTCDFYQSVFRNNARTAVDSRENTTNFSALYFFLPASSRSSLNNLRFHLPLPPLRLTNVIQNATSFGPSCSQQSAAAGVGIAGVSADLANAVVSQVKASPLFPSSQITDSEDCELRIPRLGYCHGGMKLTSIWCSEGLSINVIAPASGLVTPLPVLVWIYGGGVSLALLVSPSALREQN